MADVVVLGSANLDVVLEVPSIPAPGQTVMASAVTRHPGGKGLNQAVAAARSGVPTALIAAVGDDDAGARLTDEMHAAEVDTAMVQAADEPTGTATIVVQPDGENTIVVVPGANHALTLRPPCLTALSEARVLVAQLEVPGAVIAEAAAHARAAGTSVVLNAAPADRSDRALLGLVDVLVVNEHEARTLAGIDGDAFECARALATEVDDVVVTRGAAGAVRVAATGTEESVAAPAVTAVDATGAGDAFTGTLAAALSERTPMEEALRRAVAAGALSVQRPGAVPSMPHRAEVDEQLRLGDR